MSAVTASGARPPVVSVSSAPNPWVIAVLVALATFMEVLDTTIANVALRYIAGSMGVSQDEASWVVTSYLVSNAVSLTASSFLARRFGRKAFFLTCLGLFTVSSVLCGMAWNLQSLLLFRILQGLGGGGMVPVSQSILADAFPPEKRGQAFALFGVAVVVAPVVGPTLGGWISDNLFVALVFSDQRPGRAARDDADRLHPARALGRRGGAQAPEATRPPFRHRRFRAGRDLPGCVGNRARPRPGRRLVRIELHRHLRDHLRPCLRADDPMGSHSSESSRRYPHGRHPSVRVLLRGHAGDRRHPLRDDAVSASAGAGGVWLHGDVVRPRPLAGRSCHHGHDVRRRPPLRRGPAQVPDRHRRSDRGTFDVRSHPPQRRISTSGSSPILACSWASACR